VEQRADATTIRAGNLHKCVEGVGSVARREGDKLRVAKNDDLTRSGRKQIGKQCLEAIDSTSDQDLARFDAGGIEPFVDNANRAEASRPDNLFEKDDALRIRFDEKYGPLG